MFKPFTLLLLILVAIFAKAQERSELEIIVLIPEEVIRRPVPDPAAETEIMRALLEAGFKLVDLNQSELLESREALKLGLEPELLADLKSRFSADVLITGEAFSEEDTVISGVSFFQARLEVKAINLANGQLFYSEAFTAPGKNVTPSVAAKDALQVAASEAGLVLPEKLDAWLASVNTTGRVLVLRLENVPSFRAYTDTLDQLRALSGVQEVSSEQFDAQGSEVEVSFQGTQEDLAILLEESLGLSVTGLSAGEIRASF